jgi:hypothetical protein
MSEQDAELEQMRAGVSCAASLEDHPPPWQLDKKESTGRCLKYRRAKGEILLVTHEARGCARHRGGAPPGTTKGRQEAHVLARPGAGRADDARPTQRAQGIGSSSLVAGSGIGHA